MTFPDIGQQRLINQRVEGSKFETPQEAVRWIGAVQSQDYGGAKWALGQRVAGVTDADVDRVFNDGAILRTHILRPTWHFVDPADIRWMLALTAPRIHALSAYYYRQTGLDDDVFRLNAATLTKALSGGQQLTRAELGAALTQAGIVANDLRLGYLMMHAELTGVICSGGRRGKQFTYALLEERVPPAPRLTREEALAELVRRYFLSHGPATIADFVWWSSLSVADAKAGLDAVQSQLQRETIDGQTYWFGALAPVTANDSPVVYLLPNYDEGLVSYKDRSAVVEAQYAHIWDDGNAVYGHFLVIDYRIVGTWRRTLKARAVTVEVKPFKPLTDAERAAVEAEATRYGAFLGLAASVVFEG
jgi:hypothetical protein